MLLSLLGIYATTLWFQSSPSGNAGCYFVPETLQVRFTLFQSSPSGNAGCYIILIYINFVLIGFNPHPAVMLGATPFALALGIINVKTVFARIAIIAEI